MTAEQDFFLYLLELYAVHKNKKSGAVLKEWDDLGLTELIYNMYERYHSEVIENAFEDIDYLIQERLLRMGQRREEGL